MHKGQNLQCPVYRPPRLPHGGLIVGIEGRAHYEYARQIVWGPTAVGVDTEEQKGRGSVQYGVCAVPVVPKYVSHARYPPAYVTDF